MTDSGVDAFPEEQYRPTSQEDQLRIILRRVWAEFSAEVGLAEMTLLELASADPISYASTKRGPGRRRMVYFERFLFVQAHAAAFGRVVEQIARATSEYTPVPGADLRLILWELDDLRRARHRWRAKYGRFRDAEIHFRHLDEFQSGVRPIGR